MENSLSEQILKVLENNSRLTNQEIAIMLGVSEEKVHMKIAELESTHIICGYHTLIDWDKVGYEDVTAFVETCVLLSQKKVDDFVEVSLELDEADITPAEGKATYQEIKSYVLDKYGAKVSSLYISQIKRKNGLEVGESYNKAKTPGARVPNCPPEKEKYIEEALHHFQMV